MLRMTVPLVVLVVELFPGFAAAQQRTDSLASMLREAEQADWIVRATLVDSTLVEGKVQADGSVARIGETEIALARVRLMERMRSGRAGVIAGARWGAGAGLGLGAFYLLLCMNTAGCDPFVAVAVPMGLGAFLGGVIGGALDTSVRWDPIWPET